MPRLRRRSEKCSWLRELPLPGLERVEAAEELVRCGPDPECVNDALAAARLDLAIMVAVNAAESMVGLRLVQRGEEPLARQGISIRAGDLERQVADALGQLLENAGIGVRSLLKVRTVPFDASISLDGSSILSGARVPLAPGEHTLTAEAPGYVSTSASVRTRALSSRTLDLKLERLEGADSLFESPWFWIGATVVLVGAGIGVVALKPSPIECLCLGGEECC
ncbi:MAG: PEGA domain-containing protein [Deltaproteobacteria bacterium]|nr:PEGA domain-containing protein [Deltaproteobacteria bacterium]